MARKPDESLEKRILEAARRLWNGGGEKALTMRAVALAARTTTPTVYQRFQDKHDILEALRRKALEDLHEAITKAKSTHEVCKCYLDFATRHRNEYRLISADWAARWGRKEPRPSFEWMREQLARELGGKPEDHTRLALALAFLVHGASTQLLVDGITPRTSSELRKACNEAFQKLIDAARNGNATRRSSNP